jgi:hypothetical protein
MKPLSLFIISIMMVCALFPVTAFSQDDARKATIRTLPIEYYASSRVGVKILYRSFDNVQRYLYLPKSFEGSQYRFVMAPKGVGMGGLPALIVRMRDTEIVFIDIYTKYLRSSASIADFNEEDLRRFEAAEQKGKIEMEF